MSATMVIPQTGAALAQPAVPRNKNTAPAVAVVTGLAVFAMACVLGGAAGSLRYTFTVAAVAAGVFLYLLYPGFYVGLVFWLWFLVPFLRRLVDYRSGYVVPNPLLLAPPAVTLISVLTVARHSLELTRRGAILFLMALGAIAYGAAIGIARVPVQDWFAAVVNWAAPVLFGFHLYIHWQDYPRLRAITLDQFLCGSLVMGAYGILQFWILPPWDREWLRQVVTDGSGLSFGSPEPTAFRVFSTMNSPGVLAPILMAGLLLLFSGQGWKRFPVAVVAASCFLLTSVRSAWLAWLAGFFVLIFCFPRRQRLRLLWILVLGAAVSVPLLTIPAFQEMVSGRFETFGQPSEDVSFMSRLGGYQQRLREAATTPFGGGIGALDASEKAAPNQLLGARDSAWIDMLVSLGWLGAALYSGAIILLLFSVVGGAGADTFAAACAATLVGLVFEFALGSTMLGATGVVLWGFAGLAMAAKKYQANRTTAYREMLAETPRELGFSE